VFDWHKHEGIDEICVVLRGSGVVEYKTGERFAFKKDDLFYNTADIEHRIENMGDEDNEFYFIRLLA
jgi:mannose-6-phosphate isomerase-like protein (cupin superfamily)